MAGGVRSFHRIFTIESLFMLLAIPTGSCEFFNYSSKNGRKFQKIVDENWQEELSVLAYLNSSTTSTTHIGTFKILSMATPKGLV